MEKLLGVGNNRLSPPGANPPNADDPGRSEAGTPFYDNGGLYARPVLADNGGSLWA